LANGTSGAHAPAAKPMTKNMIRVASRSRIPSAGGIDIDSPITIIITCENWSSDIMAAVTIRNLPEATHRALKVRAAQHGRSTEAENSGYHRKRRAA